MRYNILYNYMLYIIINCIILQTSIYIRVEFVIIIIMIAIVHVYIRSAIIFAAMIPI